MKYLFVLPALLLLFPAYGFARETVVINNERYMPDPKPKFNLNKALHQEGERVSNAQAPNEVSGSERVVVAPEKRQTRQNMFPQGRDRTQAVIEQQKEKQKKMQAENIAAEAENSLLNYENQYRKLGNLFYSRMLMEAENKIIEMQRRRVLDQRKFEEEMSIKTDTAELENLMGLRLPSNAQPLPVIQQPERKPEPPRPVAKRDNDEPPLRVVGIQGYRGRFTAQIMNQGGITNVAPGMDLEHGVHILSISENGVKVRRSRQTDTGETRTEVITLPLSR